MNKLLILVFILAVPVTLRAQNPVMKARALAGEGKADLAIRTLDDAINKNRDYRLFLQRAEVNIGKGDYSSAITDFNEANSIVAGSGEFGLSRVYSLRGDAQTALYHLELMLKSPFRLSEKEILLNPSFGAIENSSEWKTFWRKEWYTGFERQMSEVEYYTSAGKTDEARIILSEMKRDYPGRDEVIYSESLVDLASGKIQDAVRIISGLADLHPENEKYQRLLAKAQLESSNFAGASSTYTRLLETGVADAEILLQRAECFRKTGESEKAISDVLQYLEYYPRSRQAISMAGRLEAQSGDNLKALEYFSKNLELHPGDAECYVDRGNSYLVSRSWDWAVKDYSMSLDIKPDNADVWLNKGIALLGKGDVQDACHDFRKSLSLGNKRAADYISRNCIK